MIRPKSPTRFNRYSPHFRSEPIYEVGEHEGNRYFSMKLIGGPCVQKVLPRYTADPNAAAKLMVTVAEAVHHAHQRGILHRDLKPREACQLRARGRPIVALSVETGTEARAMHGHTNRVRCVAFSPRRNRLASLPFVYVVQTEACSAAEVA